MLIPSYGTGTLADYTGLASGQSNMEHPMEGWKWLPHSSIYRYKEEISDSDYPDIRLFSVPKYPAAVEIEDVPEKRWDITIQNR